MGSQILTLIPRDPWFLPSAGNIKKAMLLLSTLLPNNHGVKYAIEEIPLFLHPIEGYAGIYCPFCGQDIEDWSWEVMNAMYDENKFEVLVDLTLPCCHNHTSLNDLDFRDDTGFAVFRIEMWNPWLPLQDVPVFPDPVEVCGRVTRS